MNFSQVIIPANRVRPLLRRLDTRNIAWVCCPHTEGTWRVLAADVMAEAGEFGVADRTASQADAVMAGTPGSSCSPGWDAHRQRWQAGIRRRAGDHPA